MTENNVPIPDWCTRIIDQVLPNDLVINEEKGLVSLVVRRITSDEYLVIPKYKVSHNGLWSIKYLGPLYRLLELYAPRAVKKTLTYVRTRYSPHYGVFIPVETISNNTNHIYTCSGSNIDSAKDVSKLDKYSSYKWSNTISYLVEKTSILEVNALTECIWPTGSILLGSFKEFSDIDIVFRIDSPSCYKKIIEFITGYYKSVLAPKSALTSKYIAREAKWRDISPGIIRKALRKWQRIRIGTIDVSISPVDISSRLENESRIFILTNKTVLKEVYVEPYQRSAASYPGLVETNEEYIVSYDGIYTPLLFEGGKLVVQGLQAKIKLGEEYLDAIVIGVAETETYVYEKDTPL